MHDDPVAPHSWMIGIDSWIIQDGNYPDFYTGQRTDFALEFTNRGELRRVDEAQRVGVQWIAGAHYEVTARVVHDEPNAQVLDFGVLAYHFVGIEDPEHQSHVGAWVAGVIHLSVDPFFYRDELAREDGFPALMYPWTVDEVLQGTRENRPRDRSDHLQADTRPGYSRVEKTDAWGDISMSPTYLLRCRMEPAPRSAVRSLGHP